MWKVKIGGSGDENKGRFTCTKFSIGTNWAGKKSNQGGDTKGGHRRKEDQRKKLTHGNSSVKGGGGGDVQEKR